MQRGVGHGTLRPFRSDFGDVFGYYPTVLNVYLFQTRPCKGLSQSFHMQKHFIESSFCDFIYLFLVSYFNRLKRWQYQTSNWFLLHENTIRFIGARFGLLGSRFSVKIL